VVFGVSGAPKATYVHSTGNVDGVSNAGMNANFSVNPPSVNFAMPASNSVIPTTGLLAVSYFGATFNWAGCHNVPATPGTYYFWAGATDGSGALVSAAITVTWPHTITIRKVVVLTEG
jgi:hypothetical protein